MGAAEDCWHRARQYVLDRKTVRPASAANQLVQKKLADMQTEITLGLHGAYRLGRLLEADRGGAAGDLTHEAQQLRQGAGDRARRATCTAATVISDEFHVMHCAVQPPRP
jgi:glutaryl-CoA dehydrogenase